MKHTAGIQRFQKHSAMYNSTTATTEVTKHNTKLKQNCTERKFPQTQKILSPFNTDRQYQSTTEIKPMTDQHPLYFTPETLPGSKLAFLLLLRIDCLRTDYLYNISSGTSN